MLAEGSIDQVSAPTSASSKSISGGEPCSKSNAIDLHYGARQALRGVSLARATRRHRDLRARAQRRRQDQPVARADRRCIRSARGTILWEGQDITPLPPDERARRGIAYVPQGREIFPLLTVEENLRDRLRAAQARRAPHPGRRILAVPGAGRHAGPARRRSLRRPAAAARDRPRAGHAAAALAPRRADRGHPAVHHQGYRPRHHASAPAAAKSPSCWSSSISILPASSATALRSWTAARSSMRASAADDGRAARVRRAMAL